MHRETPQAVQPMNIVPSELSFPNAELADLVDRFLDQRLDEAGGARLEGLLQESMDAKIYFADRLRLHSDLRTLTHPMRIEIHEDRNLVIEQTGGLSAVTASRMGRVSVSPMPAGPVAKWTSDWRLLAMVGMVSVLLLALSIWGVVTIRTLEALRAAPIQSILPLEDASFEAFKLDDGADRRTAVGWKMNRNGRQASVLNPATDPDNNRYGGSHLPTVESQIDGSNVLSLGKPDTGSDCGWANQRLYGGTEKGTKPLYLTELDGRTLRVTLTLARPAVDSGTWAAHPVHLNVGIKDEGDPGRVAAIYRINTGADAWEAADRTLGMKNDSLRKISFDLQVTTYEMRGEAMFFLEVDSSTFGGAEIYVDQIHLELVGEPKP